MNKILLLLLLAVSHLQAQETAAFNQHDIVALGDIGSIKSSLSDNSTSEAAAKNWAQLSDDQRKVLAPLGSEWDTLRPWQREKMLDIAKDYPKMDTQKQQRVQKRLNSWSRMTPYEQIGRAHV